MSDDSLNAENIPRAINSGGADCDKCSGDALESVLATKPIQIGLAIVAVVLSIGVVAALLLFIYLCFQKPEAANLIIPLVIGVFVPTATHFANKSIESAKANKRIAEKTKPSP